jgi:hypothetical protein
MGVYDCARTPPNQILISNPVRLFGMTINDYALVIEIDVHHGNEIKKKPHRKSEAHLWSTPLGLARFRVVSQ